MGRAVITGGTDQSIRFWAYDADGAAVAGEAYNSAGMAVSVVVRSAGRIVSTTALTLVARSGAGVHTDSALTEVGNGEYVVDLPDSYSATALRDISLTVASTAITGAVLVETLAVGQGSSQASVDALAISLAGTAITVVNRVTGGTINAVMGDDYKVRSGSELSIVVSDPAGALHTRLAAIGVGNLAFGASRVGEAAGEITGTIASLAYLSDVLTIVVEITACGASLRPDNYTYQIQSSQTHGSEVDDVVEVTGRLVLSRRTVAAVS